ncbi:hypothetical protein PV328_010018 [Microctonus aethiopoides]|uniref:Uncharacterized protein n=1 Tax=Microctonus aethiopoides TaxID=144406 RepID=A0AA39C776_9HYME|nr:hypothetical protein PV328_010018 [Microctonus aethiopoides]
MSIFLPSYHQQVTDLLTSKMLRIITMGLSSAIVARGICLNLFHSPSSSSSSSNSSSRNSSNITLAMTEYEHEEEEEDDDGGGSGGGGGGGGGKKARRRGRELKGKLCKKVIQELL